jgi:hypothetical protein
MLSRDFKSSALLKELRSVAHALNAIGLSANVAIIFGVNPMLLVNASRVGFESIGTCSGFGTAVLFITISASNGLQLCYTNSSSSMTGRRGFYPSFSDAPTAWTTAEPVLRPGPG